MEEFDGVVIGDVIQIVWNDAWVDAGHWVPDTDLPWPRYAVGYFIECRDGHVVFAQDRSFRDDRWQTISVIPVPLIQSWTILETCRQDDVVYELTTEGWSQAVEEGRS